jgi:phosphoserine phosphatase
MNTPASTHHRLEISMDDQILELFGNDKKIRSFPISTSAKGMGFSEGSLRTPTGRFRVSEKIGAEQPLLTIFKGRKPIGVWDGKPTEEDLILTRILRLEGLDSQNANTLDRFIYLHGTNQEELIGTPASHGCIRLKNRDMAELFDLVSENSEVVIHPLSIPKAKILFLDCDSTLSAIEGIDELARLSDPDTYVQVVELTNRAMNGEVPLDEVFRKRMQIIKPTRDMIDTVSRQYLENVIQGVDKCIQIAKYNGWEIVIISGGFEPVIRPFANQLGIRHIEAVPLFFDKSGNYTGYGEDYPTTRNLGKNEIIREWKQALAPKRVIMVGDGISDLETKPDVDLMIGYGGVVERAEVKSRADHWITDLNDLIGFLS